uniref:Uncharacterized protein n=1 Tax=Arundo donax TaxID=35708 RepID=A0A0A9A0W8_ARUDO
MRSPLLRTTQQCPTVKYRRKNSYLRMKVETKFLAQLLERSLIAAGRWYWLMKCSLGEQQRNLK